jgi:hypothetical protein
MPSAAWQACRAAMALPGCSLKHRRSGRIAALATPVVLFSFAVSHHIFFFIKSPNRPAPWIIIGYCFFPFSMGMT